MAYGNKYLIQYYCNDDLIQLKIYQNGFVGTVTNLTAGPVPYERLLDSEGDDRFAFFKPTSLSINILCEVYGDFDEFRNITPQEYKVEEWEDGVQKGTFWVNDEMYSEPYARGGYIITLTATDGLGILSGRRTALTGRKTHLEMVRECLDSIGFGLNIVDAINIVEEDQTTGGPLIQTKYDADLFTENENPQDRFTLDVVLKDILKTYTASITQVNNKWVLTDIESFDAGVTGYEYTSAGAYVGVYTGVSDLLIAATGAADTVYLTPGGTIEKYKGVKELSVKQNYGKADGNLIKNGTFGNTYVLPPAPLFPDTTVYYPDWYYETSFNPGVEYLVSEYQIAQKSGGGKYIRWAESGGNETYYTKLEDYTLLAAEAVKEYVFELKYALLQDSSIFSGKWKIRFTVEAVDGATVKWLDFATQTWEAVETHNLYEDVPFQNKDDFWFHTLEIRTTGFPGGKLRVTIDFYEKVVDTIYYGAAVGGIKFYSTEIVESTGVKYTKGLTNSEFTEIVKEVMEFNQIDIPASITNGELFYKNYLSLAADDSLTHVWSSRNYTGSLADIALNSILEAQGRNYLIKRFPGSGKITPHSVLVDENGVRYQPISFSIEKRLNQFTVKCVEIIEPLTVPITYTESNYSDDESTGTSTNNSGGNGTTSGGGTTTTGGGGTTVVTDDRNVAMLNALGVETGPPGRLADKYFRRDYFDNKSVYAPMGAGYGLEGAFNDFQEVLLGNFPTLGTGDSETWITTDRLFAVGMGVDSDNRADALTILKNGNTGIGTASLTEKLNIGGNGIFTGTVAHLTAGGDGTKSALLSDVTGLPISTFTNDAGYVAGSGLTTNTIPIWDGTNLVNSKLTYGTGTIASSSKFQAYQKITTNFYLTGVQSYLNLIASVTEGSMSFGDEVSTTVFLTMDKSKGLLVGDGTSGSTTTLQSETTTISENLYLTAMAATTDTEVLTYNTSTKKVGYKTITIPPDATVDLTTNYLPVMGASTLENSVIYQSDGYVGIGTTTPSEKLDVIGTIRASINFELPDSRYIVWGDGSGRTNIYGNNTTKIISLNNCNVGIGTTSPSEKLHVVGNTLITGVVTHATAAGVGSCSALLSDVTSLAVSTFTNDAGYLTAVDLGQTRYTNTVEITNTGGDNVTIGSASGTQAGFMSVTQHDELDSAYAHISLTNNPHNVTAAQLGALTAIPLAGVTIIGGFAYHNYGGYKFLGNDLRMYDGNLSTDTPLLTDYIGFGDVSAGVNKNCTLNTLKSLIGTAGVTSIVAGDLIDVSGTTAVTVNVDLSELAIDATATTSDYIPWLDVTNGQKKMLLSTLATLVGGGSSLWTSDTYGIYYSSGNVGIGTGPAYNASLYIQQSTNSYGVYVNATTGRGLDGVATTGYGVSGTCTDAAGVGVFGYSLSGWSGYFAGSGKGLYSNKLSINSETTHSRALYVSGHVELAGSGYLVVGGIVCINANGDLGGLTVRTDASAADNSFYYSSTQSAPCYKISGSTIFKMTAI